MIKVKISTGWTAIPMAKGQHPLEEMTVAIELVDLLNVIKVQTTTVSFAVMLKVLPSERQRFRKGNCSGKHKHFGTLDTVGGTPQSNLNFGLCSSFISLEINRILNN